MKSFPALLLASGAVACGTAATTPSLVSSRDPLSAAAGGVHLRAHDGEHLVVAEGGGGGAVLADRTSAGPWETFRLVDLDGGEVVHGDVVLFGTHDGAHYVMAQSGGAAGVHAASVNDGPWESFTLRRAAGEGVVRDGDEVALQASSGHWLAAELGGGGAINANRDGVGPWETFRIFQQGSPLLRAAPVEAAAQVHLRAHAGTYVVAELGGGDAVNANRDGAGPWETFDLIDLDGGRVRHGDLVALRTHDGAHFLNTPGGGVLRAESTRVANNSTFVLERVAGDGNVSAGDAIALRSRWGTYVVAELGGGDVVNANRDGVGPWETFGLEVAAGSSLRGHPNPLVGQLRIAGGVYVDDAGPVLPVFCHFGEAFSRYLRDPAAVRRQLDVIAEAGYHGVRFWTTLGGWYWAGRDVGPDITPDYFGQLRAFLLELESRQLKAVISQGDIGRIPDRRDYANRLSDVLDGIGTAMVAIIEGGNEAWQTGESDPVRLAQFMQYFEDRHPGILKTISSPPGEEKAELDAWSIAPADVFDVHGYRGGRWWDKVRHIFSIQYEGQPMRRLGWQGEPTGPGDAVSVTDNKEELDDDTLAAMAAMSLMTRQAWCYMSGPGVLFDSPIDAQPGFWTVPAMATVLPRDVMSYTRLFHGGSAWSNDRIFMPSGETRTDHAMADDGRFVAIVYGPRWDYTQVRPASIDSVTDLGDKARIIIGRRQ